jgi:hypothetical protein
MRVSLIEAKFTIDLTENQLTTVIEALIYYGEKEMDTYAPLAKQRLEMAQEMRDHFAADLEAHKRNFLGSAIQHKLDALKD